MAESIVHSDSVRIGVDYIKTLIPSDLHCLIQSDLPEIKLKPERTVENFVPDIRLDTDSLKIIGEAKTDNDTMRQHSIDQYESYLNECLHFTGTSHLIIVTSFYAFPGVVNFFRRKKKESGASTAIHVINTAFPDAPKIL